MRGFLFAFSVLFIVLGTVMVLYSEQTRSFFRDPLHRFSIRRLAVVPALLGVLLLIGAFVVRDVFWLAFILGILALAKGVYLVLGPLSQIQQLRQWWFDQASETVVRLMGLITFMIGVALFSWLL